MGKMIYLMGKSSSGKDTIYRRLLGRRKANFKRVVPYTTRPIRMGETDGEEYHFTEIGAPYTVSTFSRASILSKSSWGIAVMV